MNEQSRVAELIVVGGFNTDLERTGGQGQDKEIMAVVETADLEYFLGHFLPRCHTWCKDRTTWVMVGQGREVRSRTDCIMGSDCRVFWKVAVQDPGHNYDHFMVMGCLRGASPRDNHQTFRDRKV